MKTVVAKWDKHEPCEHKQMNCDHYIRRCVPVITCVRAPFVWAWPGCDCRLFFVCECEKASAAPIHYPVNTAWARAII